MSSSGPDGAIPADREEALRDYLRGAMSAERARAFEDELLHDRALAQAVFEEVNLDAALDELRAERARRSERSEPSWWRRGARVAVPLAAAAVLATFVVTQRLDREPPNGTTLRSEPGEWRGLEPAGEVAGAPAQFLWTTHPDAALYRLELLDISQNLVFEAETPETTLVWPAEAMALRGGTWRVVPRDASGERLPATRPIAFRIAP